VIAGASADQAVVALPGPKPEFFFAPTHLEQQQKLLGAEVFGQRHQAAQQAFMSSTEGWLEVVVLRTRAAVAMAYRDLLNGRVEPARGLICVTDAE
jgi:hypothetical protein